MSRAGASVLRTAGPCPRCKGSSIFQINRISQQSKINSLISRKTIAQHDKIRPLERRSIWTNATTSGSSFSSPALPGRVIFGACLTGISIAAYLSLYSPPVLHSEAPKNDSISNLSSGNKVQITGKDGKDTGDEGGRISTGTSTVPYFPRVIWLPRSNDTKEDGKSMALPAGTGLVSEEEEYQLLGVGVRKVSLFRIEVYVVGIYVAKSDLSRLQEQLVKASVGSGASALVKGEKDNLRHTLLDGAGSEKIWNEVLRQGNVRSAVRIVPVKNTNFSHLRDGWLRAIDARKKGEELSQAQQQEDFESSIAAFKTLMGGNGSVAKGRVLLLGRGGDGSLRMWVEESAASALAEPTTAPLLIRGNGMSSLGKVSDERIARLIWLNYLSGDYPASEDARKSVVEGVIEIVERPIGTVETQVI